MHNYFEPFTFNGVSTTRAHHWLQWNHEERLIFEPLIFNNKPYNEHCPLKG
jgi:hypothetical protein